MLKQYAIVLLNAMLVGSPLLADRPTRMVSETDNAVVYIVDHTNRYEILAMLRDLIQKGSLEDFKLQGMPYLTTLDQQDLSDVCAYYRECVKALEIACELHTKPELYTLIGKMQQEVRAMPAQPKPQHPGRGLIPNVYLYIDQKRDALQVNAQNVDVALHERALELLPYLRNESLKRVLTAKKIIDTKTDKQIDAYMTSEKERLNAIHEIIVKELETWEYFFEPDYLGWTDGRCGFRKKMEVL